MADRNNVDVSGNLTKDPHRWVADDGKVRAYVTVAVNPPPRPDGTVGNTTYIDGVVRGPSAENVLASLEKGSAVIGAGRLENVIEPGVTQNGRTFDMTTTRVAFTKFGPDLTFATAEVTKNPRPENQGQAGGFGGGQQGGGFGQGQPQQGQGVPQGAGFGQGQGAGFGQNQGAPQGGGFGGGQPGGGFDQAQQGAAFGGQPQGAGFGGGQQGGFGGGQGFGA